MAGFSETGGPGGRRLTVSDVLRILLGQRQRLAGSMDRYRYLILNVPTRPILGCNQNVHPRGRARQFRVIGVRKIASRIGL